MPKFTRTVIVDAEQIVIEDKHKAAVKKGIPTNLHGGDLKVEGTNEKGEPLHIIPLHLSGKTVQAVAGDWIVNEEGVEKLYSDEDFKKTFTSHTETAEHKAPEVSGTVVTETGHINENPNKE